MRIYLVKQEGDPHPKIRVAMLVTNDVANDSRVKKQAVSLQAAGHEVRIFAIASARFAPGLHFVEGVEVLHLSISSSDLKQNKIIIFIGSFFLIPWKIISRVAIWSIDKLLARITTPTPPAWKKLTALITQLKTTTKRWLGARYTRSVLAKMYRRNAIPAAKEWRPHLVHCHDYDTLAAGEIIARSVEANFIYDSHELWSGRNVARPNYFPNRVMQLVELNKEKSLMGRSSGVITVSDGIADILFDRTRSLKTRPTIVRNIPEVPGPGRVTSNPEKDTIYYSGRITEGRVLERLITSVACLGDSSIAIKLLGYGPENYIDTLRQLADENHVQLETVPPVESRYVAERLSVGQAVFVGVEPIVQSYELSLPNKYFEALFSGRPVIVPKLPEMIRESKGLKGIHFYDPFDPVSIQKAITSAFGDDFDCTAALAKRTDRFSWGQESAKLIDLYSQVLLTASRETSDVTIGDPIRTTPTHGETQVREGSQRVKPRRDSLAGT